MKTDRYTRVVLTIIAACLLVLVLRPLALVPAAAAAAPAGDRRYGIVPVNADGSVTVRLQTGAPMKVSVVSITSPSRHTNSDDLYWDTIPLKNEMSFVNSKPGAFPGLGEQDFGSRITARAATPPTGATQPRGTPACWHSTNEEPPLRLDCGRC